LARKQVQGVVQAVEATQQGAPEEQAHIKDKTMATTLIGAHGLEHFYGHSFPVLITAMYASLAMDPLQAGILSTVRQIAGGLTSVGSGFFVDIFRYRSGQVLAVSMALIGIGYLLVSVSPNYIAILGALIVASAGSALWHPPALGLLARRFPQQRGLFISLHRATGNAGDLAGPLVAGALLSVLGWRWIMGGGTPLLFVLSGVVLILLWNVGGPKPGPVDLGRNLKAQIGLMSQAFQGTGMWSIFIVSAVRGMGDRAYVFFLPLYLSQELGMDPFTREGAFLIGVAVALVAAPGVISGPIFGWLSDRVGRRSVIAFLMLVAVVLSVTTVLGDGGFWMWTSITLFGLFHSSVNSLTQAAAIDEVEGKGLDATFMGLMWGSNAAFGALAGVGVGALVAFTSWSMAFYAAAVMFFLGFLVTLIMPRGGSHLAEPAH
jgi:MFS family permease